MRFFSAIISTVAVAATSVAALANPFTMEVGYTVSAGRPAKLTWNPTTGGTVTLVLREGTQGNLNTIQTIVAHTQNDGEYTWIPSESIVYGTDYSIEIIDDQDETNVNYSAYLTIKSPNTVSSISSSVSHHQTTAAPSSYTTKPSTSAVESTTTGGSVSHTVSGRPSYTIPPHHNNSTMTTRKSSHSTKLYTHSQTHAQTTSHALPSPTKSGNGGSAPTDNGTPQQKNAAGMLALAIAGAVMVL